MNGHRLKRGGERSLDRGGFSVDIPNIQTIEPWTERERDLVLR
jgi:hypothetical protein